MDGFRNALLVFKRAFSFAPFKATLAWIALTVLLTGCFHSDPRADIVIANGAEPETLDPAIATGQPDGRIIRQLFEGLTRADPVTAAPTPGLAERWDISPDGRIYTFHIRTNAKWSTGQAITARDVLYSWKRVLDPATAAEYAGQLYFIKNAEDYNLGKTTDANALGIQVVNDHTLRVELVGPTPFFLDLCSFPTLAVTPRFAVEEHRDRWLLKFPVPCSGAYTLEAWRLHDKIRIRKNPHHWDVANIKNNVVDFLPVESPTTALNLYETGQADIIWDKGLIPSELMDILRSRPDCHTFDYLGTFFYRYNVTKKPFDDVRVRKALAMAIDKSRITQRITRGGEKVANHYTPRGIPNYRPPEGLSYDPDAARKLLAEAGFPGGKGFPRFRYLFKTGRTDEQIAVELQAMFQNELGIKMELHATEWKVYLAMQNALDFDLSRSSWIGDYNDPNTFLDMYMSNNGNNRTGWKSPQYDQLIRDANSQVDTAKREALLQRAETMLIRDELPIVPLYFYAGVTFFRTNIGGIYFNMVDEHPVHAIHRK